MNPDFEGFARLAWIQLWQVTVVALVIGTTARLCRRARPRVAYALWMLVVVKSIAPPIWSSPTGLFSWALVDRSDIAGESPRALINPTATHSVDRGSAQTANGIENGAARGVQADWARFRLTMLSIWFVGLMLCAAYVLGKQIACLKVIRRSSLPVDERYLSALRDLSRRLGVKREVRLIVTSRPIGPVVFGVFRPSILLPGPLVVGSPLAQVELMIAHELIHVRRSDVLASQLQLIAQLIWWFNPLVWWANREANRERERCCDEEVVAGVGCKPGLYARTLLSVLEQKARLRSLVALPGVRALEITSLRLETIMKHTQTDQKRASRISRIAFAVGAALLIPGTGLTLRAQPPAQDGADAVAPAAPTKTAAAPLQGVVREKGTGRPVAGARISVNAINDEAATASSSAITDKEGRYTIADLPKSRKYHVIALPKSGEPYLITGRIVDAAKDAAPITADLEFVRGIPFRVRVLDQETGKPIKGQVSYFPISPNNPFERGAMGYVLGGYPGCGAFYESGPDDQGVFLGGVLSGPGILGFSRPYKPGDESRADRKPPLSFPDGKENIKLIPNDSGGPLGFVPVSSEPLSWTALPLGQFDAVIAINPRKDAEAITYEIRIPSDKAAK